MIIKNLLAKIKCLQMGIKYKKGIWIHPSVKICTPSGCAKLSEGVHIHKGVRIDGGGKVIFGEDTVVNTYTRIESEKNVIIGKDVGIGPNVYISDRNHEYRNVKLPIMKQGYYTKGPLEIGEGTWVGIHACIIGKVKIGRGCVIGANAVVTKDVPDYCVVVGNPGKIIRHYNVGQQNWENV